MPEQWRPVKKPWPTKQQSTFKLLPDAHAGPRRIRSCSRPGHELSSTVPTALHAAAQKIPPPTFQLLVKGIEMIGSQFNVDARSLLRCRALRSERIAAIVDQQAYRPARRPADADHRKLRSLVDFNRKTELVSVK